MKRTACSENYTYGRGVVVVALAVEQRHSVRADLVRISAWTCFFRFRIPVNLVLLIVVPFLNNM